jgi:hypothetical protein
MLIGQVLDRIRSELLRESSLGSVDDVPQVTDSAKDAPERGPYAIKEPGHAALVDSPHSWCHCKDTAEAHWFAGSGFLLLMPLTPSRSDTACNC